MTADVVDVAVVGAGVVGSAIARELAGHELSVALIDARDDVGDGTSKANTAILHTGFDAVPGTAEARLVARGYELLGEYAPTVGIPIERTGAVLVAWSDDEVAALPAIADKATRNGYRHCSEVSAEEVYSLVPALGPGALGGLRVPGESIICPWTTTLAFATEAVHRGAALRLGQRVSTVSVGADVTVLHTQRGDIVARWVVNAAGLGSDVVDGLFGHERFAITPRRGELLVFDKLSRALVDTIVLPVPTAKGKGVLVSPTIFGNVMLGPTAEDRDDRSDTSTSEQGFDFLRRKGEQLMPALMDEDVAAAYAGLRAATEHGDYVIDIDDAQRYVVVGGIRSTGLTASMAIAERVVEMLDAAGLELDPRSELPPPPVMPQLGEAFPRPYSMAELIDDDPAYGDIVCFCERVSRGEVRDAFSSTIPPADLDGLRRRTRVMMGRCQGFFCGAEVDALMREQLP